MRCRFQLIFWRRRFWKIISFYILNVELVFTFSKPVATSLMLVMIFFHNFFPVEFILFACRKLQVCIRKKFCRGTISLTYSGNCPPKIFMCQFVLDSLQILTLLTDAAYIMLNATYWANIWTIFHKNLNYDVQKYKHPDLNPSRIKNDQDAVDNILGILETTFTDPWFLFRWCVYRQE